MTIIALLRGINVGGHHKVPMSELRVILKEAGCENVKTLLNSGNVLFQSNVTNILSLQQKIEQHISEYFGFPIPLLLINKNEVAELVKKNPFAGINMHKDTRLYVSFLKTKPETSLRLPFFSKDNSFQIISVHDKLICSVLDLSLSKTPQGMEILEKLFGKDMTTRNWNTILKLLEIRFP